MGLRFDPMGGGQFKQAVKSIIEAESQPLKAIQERKSREEAKLKLFQDFKGKFSAVEKALGEISNFRRFRELKADLGDGNGLVSVNIDKEKAEIGSYTIQVDELAARTSVMSNGFEDADDTSLGIGFVVMRLDNGDNAEVFVDGDHASLRGIASLVNAQSNSPVRASVMKDMSDSDAPWKLILTAKKDGQANQVTFPEFYFLDGSKDIYIDNTRDAQNAVVTVDGFPIELESNDIPDFLPGVSLHLKQAKPNQPFNITISEDYQKISGKMKGFVDQTNQILQFIIQQNSIDEKSDTRTTFAGDQSLQGIEYRLRNLMHEGFQANDPSSDDVRLLHMSDLGVEFDKSGMLTFKEDKFTKMIEKDFDGVAEALTGSFGFAYQMKSVLAGYTRGGDGLLQLREHGIKDKIKEMDNQIDARSKILERRQQSLTEQFSRLESSLSNMQRQQQSLSATLPGGGGGGGNAISQLLGG